MTLRTQAQPGNALALRTQALIHADRAQIHAQVQAQAQRTVSTGQGEELYELLMGTPMGAAGTPVTEKTAMLVSAVYAGVALLGGALASLPFHVYKRQDNGRDRHETPLWWLFNESPWVNWTAASAWQYMMQSILLRGDGFMRIHRGVGVEMGAIRGLEPLLSAGVQVDQVKGRNIYSYYDHDGVLHVVDQDDMLHFPGIGFNGRRSLTPISSGLKVAVGIALDADQYAQAFFRNGARPDFVLKTEAARMTEEQIEFLRRQWISRHSGPANAHLPAILTGGMEAQQLTMTAEDAQLLATRQFQVEDIARCFGIPPHMLGYMEKSTSFGAGIEQQSISFIRYTMRRYIDPIQQEINRKVWSRSLKVFGEFSVDALLEGDSAAQAAYFSKALGGPGSQGWMRVNEVRSLKNMPPVEGGDELVFAGSKKSDRQPSKRQQQQQEQKGKDNASDA